MSKRQRQVAMLVAAGHASKEIARSLRISPLTVRKHRSGIFTRLEVHSVSELASRVLSLNGSGTPSE